MSRNMYQHILDKAKPPQTPQRKRARSQDHAAPAKKRQQTAGRDCGWPGCTGDGEHRAPKSRDELTDYYWFCLDHVRTYNKAWNYYAGLSEDEVEREVRRDTTWNRPSWPLGGKRIIDQIDGIESWIRDQGLDGDTAARRARGDKEPATAKTPDPVIEAIEVLALDWPLDAAELKRAYKDLVKQHHPDANGGDKRAEERFKQITVAYKVVLEFLET